MAWSDYWNALTSRQRIGFAAGGVIIVAATAGVVFWWLHDPYVTLAAGLSTERFNEFTQELDRAKVNYRIADSADAIAVPRSQLGAARAAAAGGPLGVPQSVGLELFNETDFSANDFAQRINYQRALQGELTRTLQTVEGVRSARVHIVLADEGLFKRSTGKATAAVSVALQPGKVLTRAQVRGMQRLVAASVPEIKVDDVVVLDESGASLTRASAETEGDLSSAQLDIKRQADQYLENKVQRLLQDIVPQGAASVSVDTTLDNKQLRVTSEEPIAAKELKDSAHVAGVLVKERQSQHGRAAGFVATGNNTAADGDSVEREYEYKVGNRIEQTLSTPGSIKRISVAVVLQGVSASLTNNAIEELVAHAVGIDQLRGDAVSVLLLPASRADAAPVSPAGISPPLPSASGGKSDSREAVSANSLTVPLPMIIVIALVVLAAGFMIWRRGRPIVEVSPISSEAEVEAIASKVRQWLNEGASRGRA